MRDELDWEQKSSDTRELEDAIGSEFDALWNLPAGARRIGRLGQTYYRQLRDHRYADEIVTDRSEEAVIAGYDDYQDASRKEVLLFSNDPDFVARGVAHRVKSQRVEIPDGLPAEVAASWYAIQDALYVLAVVFGVLMLPKVTLYSVWKGQGEKAWQDEALEVECRSPRVRTLLHRDLRFLE